MLASFDFAVRGLVQGVFFRKHTAAKAQALGLTGWVSNDRTRADVVSGHAEGDRGQLHLFRQWLSVGSPNSRVDEVTIRNEAQISQRSAPSFEIRH